MKKIFSIAIAVSLLATPALAWDIAKMNEVIDQTNFIVDGGCSGTLISLNPALILTNYHCIDRRIRTQTRDVTNDRGLVVQEKRIVLDPVNVTQVAYAGHSTVGASTYVTEIVARQKNRDLAVLRLRAERVPYTIVSPLLPKDKTVERGSIVWAVGNPAGLDATVTRGIVSSTTRTFQFTWAEREDLPMIQADAGLFGGNSGGALYNDEGYLVGVPTAGIGQASHLGLSIPSAIVWEMLENHCLAEHLGGTNAKTCITADSTEVD
jgi:S1-C subfamily serine protease